MALIPWKTMRGLVLRHVPLCPVFEVDDALREAARTFCADSHAWRLRGLTLLTTVAGQADYAYASPPEGGELWRVHVAWNGEDEVEVPWPGESDDAPTTKTDAAWRIEAVPTNVLRLSPAPQVAGIVLKGTLSFQTARDATGLLDLFYDDYREGIASGAVAMLAAQPEKPWTKPDIVTYHQGRFDSDIRTASNQAGPVRRRPLRVTPW